MSSVRDLVDYIKTIDRVNIAVGINGRTQLNHDFERFRSMSGGVMVSEYLAKRVRPYLPSGTEVAILDPAGRTCANSALLVNIRIPDAAKA
jgi:hypothetical protein